MAKNNVATVITFHDCWYFTGKCFHYADIACEGFKSGCGNCPKKKAPPQSLVIDASAKVLKDRYKYLSAIKRLFIVGCSDWVCNEARKGILKDFNITRIYNGVDIDTFKPYENNVLKEKFGKAKYILGMANKWLQPENKPVLNTVKEMLSEHFKLVLLGCSPKQQKDLQQLDCNIIPIGFIRDRQELAQYYSSADVFVNVTYADTLPTVNMESICCGTPVITFDSCGSPELVLNGCVDYAKENNITVINFLFILLCFLFYRRFLARQATIFATNSFATLSSKAS